MMSESPSLNLPPTLEPLRELAFNFRWSWHAPAAALFEQLDPALWQATRHNPVLLLSRIEAVRLQAAARSDKYLADLDAVVADLRAYLGNQETWFRDRHGQVR